MERDSRIDLIRGYAMITICINHITALLSKVGDVGFKVPTLTHYGYSSAAEIFFFMSGYMVGMVYLSKENFIEKLYKRAVHLYFSNIALFLALALIGLTFSSQALHDTTHLNILYEKPTIGLISFLGFSYIPMFTALLYMYTLFLLSSIPFSSVLKRNALVFLCLSSTIYVFSLFFPNFKLINIASADLQWSLNIFSYQFLFMLGLFLGKKRMLVKIFSFIEQNKFTLTFPFILLFLGLVIKRYDLMALKGSWLISKDILGPVRIIHFFVVLACLISGLHLVKGFIDSKLFQMVSMVGRQSLSSFIISVILSYLSLAIWATNEKSSILYLLLTFTSLIIMLFCAWTVDCKKKLKKSWHEFMYSRVRRIIDSSN